MWLKGQGRPEEPEPFPLKGWHDTKSHKSAGLQHSPRDAAIAQHISSQIQSCVLFFQYFRRGETAFYLIFSTLVLLHMKQKSDTSIKC